jgi:predicted nucleic acid-binding protein
LIADGRTALIDANVLYSSFQRDLLIRQARRGLFHARWTDAIHDEWIRTLLRNRPDLPQDRLLVLRELMDGAVPDCLVIGYEHRIEALTLPDPNDRHVLAAAIECGADTIVTWNRRDFPELVLQSLGIRQQDPDAFLVELHEAAPGLAVQAVREHRAALHRPAYSPEAYLQRLRNEQFHRFAERLQSSGGVLL